MADTMDWRVLGERLHMARRRRGLTSGQLAALAGTTRVTISRLENTHKPHVSFDVVVRIAQVLGISLDYLAGWKEDERLDDEAPPVAAAPSVPRGRRVTQGVSHG